MALAASASNGPAALVASELMERGRKSAAALEALLQAASTSNPAQYEDIHELTEKILCCLDRALAALHGDGVVEDDIISGCPSRKRRSPPDASAEQARPKRRSRLIGAETPIKIENRSTPDDGLLWRKYGQKDIQNSKYPRTYFRCTYKYDKGCKATRQVQQSEDDPSVYVVTYFGEHTCGMHAAATVAVVSDSPKSPQLVINFGAGTNSTGSPWLSASGDEAIINSSQVSTAVGLPEEEEGEQKANVCSVVKSPVLAPQPAEPSSSADVSCASPYLDLLLHYFDWDSSGDSLFHMGFINFDESALLNSVL